MANKALWHVYLLRCSDGSFYAGSTTDLGRRLARHQKGLGARYTRGRRPLSLAWSQALRGRGRAQSLEAWIKKLAKAEKRALADKKGLRWRTRPGKPGWILGLKPA